VTSVRIRLLAFAALLVVTFSAAAALGGAVGPGRGAGDEEMNGMAAGPLGLSVTQDGLRISPATFQGVAGRPGWLRFRILGADGRVVVRGYQIEAERLLHLIVVRRDLTGYQHLHPVMGADGTWSVPFTAGPAGVYRVFADFQRGGVKRVLAGDLTIPGDYVPAPIPAASPLASADGDVVRLVAPRLRAGHEADLEFRIARGGRPVALQPYLGARGHLVALREGDLAYLHIHPHTGGAPDAGSVRFSTTFDAPGRYRLFLQFRSPGPVHTVSFSVSVAP
jgi:hypothetical protein